MKKTRLKKSDFKHVKAKKKTKPKKEKVVKNKVPKEKITKEKKPKKINSVKTRNKSDSKIKQLIKSQQDLHQQLKSKKHIRTVSEKIQIVGRSNFGGYENREGELVDILKIKGVPGARHLHYHDLSVMIEQFAGGLRAIQKSVHFVILDFMVNYQQQIDYYRFKMNQAENPSYRYWLQKEVDKLSYLQEHSSEEHYFAVVFGENELEVEEQKSLLKRIKTLGIEEITMTEKDALLYKLNNLNSGALNQLRR
jgi:hypothetical protein